MIPIEGMTVEPDYAEVDGGTMWASFVQFAITVPEWRHQFKDDTGHDLEVFAGRHPIERLIDEATGHDKAVALAWMDWVTLNYWGGTEIQR